MKADATTSKKGGPRTAGFAAPVVAGATQRPRFRVPSWVGAGFLAAASALAFAHGGGSIGSVLDFGPLMETIDAGILETDGLDPKRHKTYRKLESRLHRVSAKGLPDDLAKLVVVSRATKEILAKDEPILEARDGAIEEAREHLGNLDSGIVEFTGLFDSDKDRDRVLRAAAGARALTIKGDLARNDLNLPKATALWRKSALKFSAADRLAKKLREKSLSGDPRWEVPLQDIGAALLAVWGETGPVPALYAVGADDGEGPLFLSLARSGEAWVRVPVELAADLWWVTGVPGDAVWASGTNGAVVRWDPVRGVLSDHSTGVDATLFGIWGSGPDDLWAVGGDPAGEGPVPALLHYDGEAWTPVDVPAEAQGKMLYKVWGTSASDVWACGQGGVILHYDGDAWSPVTSGTSSTLLTVTGPSPVVAVGGGGVAAVVVERGTGGVWAPASVPTGVPALNGVFVPAAGDAIAVGFSRTVLTRGTAGWTALAGVPSTARDLHAVWIDDEGNAVMVGGNLFSLETGTLVTHGRRTLPSEIVPYASFKDRVADILYLGCAEAGCHLAPFLNEGLDFTDPDVTLETTVGVASNQSPLLRIAPGRPSRSYVWHKLLGTQSSVGGSGDDMPQGAPALPQEELDAIRAWILAGAPDDR